MAALEVDLSKIEMGQTVTVKWRGKPVFVRRRSEADVEAANKVDLSSLRDPQPDSDRVLNPEVGYQKHPLFEARRGRTRDAPCTSPCLFALGSRPLCL